MKATDNNTIFNCEQTLTSYLQQTLVKLDVSTTLFFLTIFPPQQIGDRKSRDVRKQSLTSKLFDNFFWFLLFMHNLTSYTQQDAQQLPRTASQKDQPNWITFGFLLSCHYFIKKVTLSTNITKTL